MNPRAAIALIEELLRFESPHQRTVRIVRRPTTIGGTALSEGDVLMLMNGAANRDERRYEDADQLRLTRDGRRHLAFSAGIHFCIGASLARLELRAALNTFLGRYPGYEILGEPPWLDNQTLRTLTELWIDPGPVTATRAGSGTRS